MLAYTLGPIAAVLVAVGLGRKISNDHKTIVSLDERVKVLETVSSEQEAKLLDKTMRTLLPFAKAVQELKVTVGER